MKHETENTWSMNLPREPGKPGQILKPLKCGHVVWAYPAPGDRVIELGGEVHECLDALKRDFPREPGVVLGRDETGKLAWGSKDTPYKDGFRDGALYGSSMTLFAVLVLWPLVRGVWRSFKGAKNGTGS